MVNISIYLVDIVSLEIETHVFLCVDVAEYFFSFEAFVCVENLATSKLALKICPFETLAV
jgi:hypothetical protein